MPTISTFSPASDKQAGDLECDQASKAIAVQPVRALGLGIQDQGQAVGCYFLDRQHEGGLAEVVRRNGEKRLVRLRGSWRALRRKSSAEIVAMEKENRRLSLPVELILTMGFG